MEDKVKFKDLSYALRLGVIGGIIYLSVFVGTLIFAAVALLLAVLG